MLWSDQITCVISRVETMYLIDLDFIRDSVGTWGSIHEGNNQGCESGQIRGFWSDQGPFLKIESDPDPSNIELFL